MDCSFCILNSRLFIYSHQFTKNNTNLHIYQTTSHIIKNVDFSRHQGQSCSWGVSNTVSVGFVSLLIHTCQVTSNDTKVEKPGVVTSDSLAGESAKSGGDFASNTNASVLNQPSSGSTAANTDTSGARTLNAAPDAEARQAQEDWSESAQLNAGSGLSSGGKPYNTTTGSGANTGDAPSYVSAAGAGQGGPHGKNLKEGGFDSDGPNASFNNEVGGKNDPGRAALGEFQSRGVEPIVDAGVKFKGQADNSFDALNDTSA